MLKKLGLLIAYAVPCHRREDRCIHVKGKAMPICARCLAIYPMYLLLPVLYFLIEANMTNLYIAIGLSIPMLIDGFTQKWKWRTSNNFLRVVTGTMFGLSQVMFITLLAKFILEKIYA